MNYLANELLSNDFMSAQKIVEIFQLADHHFSLITRTSARMPAPPQTMGGHPTGPSTFDKCKWASILS